MRLTIDRWLDYQNDFGPLLFIFFFNWCRIGLIFPYISILSVFELKSEILRYFTLTFFWCSKIYYKVLKVNAELNQDAPN